MEPRAKAGGAVGVRLVAGELVAGKDLFDEEREALEGGVGSAAPGLDGEDGAVEVGDAGAGPVAGHVVVGGVGLEVAGTLPGVLGVGVGEGGEVFGQEFVEPGAHGVGGELWGGKEFLRDDAVGVHGPEGDADLLREVGAPAFGDAHGVFVAEDHGGLDVGEELGVGLVRGAAKDEGDVAGGEVGLDVGQALVEEAVVAEVGAGEVGDAGEIDDEREGELVGYGNGGVEGVIVGAALGALHPVDDAFAVAVRGTGAAEGNARVVEQGVEGRGKGGVLRGLWGGLRLAGAGGCGGAFCRAAGG